ncbi:IS3 family transposase [Epilithonimonas hominis]|uniref:IS3 family transposase n=1 Tax=Epilithonimonas hominis TaxID=420404 RepID=UPI0035E3F204
MSKYSLDFKKHCVETIKQGCRSSKSVAHEMGLDATMVRRWVKFYELYGVAGLERSGNRKFSVEFKLKVLREIDSGRLSIKESALKFNIAAESSIINWQRNYEKFGILGLENKSRGRPKIMSDYKRKKRKSDKPLTREEELLLENERLRAEIAVLKKLDALILAKEKTKIIEELRREFDLAVLLDCTSMARSSFYYHQKMLQKKDKYAEIKTLIKKIYHRHKGRFGYRRITMAIRQNGIIINHKTVLRLMKTLNLKSIIRVKRYRSYRGEIGRTVPNILERNFKTNQPNRKWATDVTEFNVSGNKLYLSPIIDLFNGEIISYELYERPVFAQVMNMLKKSFRKVKNTENIILHSDQGWQYQMKVYQQLLKKKGIIQSMSRKGNCLDNAVIENLFGTLKSEMFYTKNFKTIKELKKEIKEYINYYNHDRIRLNLKGKSPVQYRTLSFNNIV